MRSAVGASRLRWHVCLCLWSIFGEVPFSRALYLAPFQCFGQVSVWLVRRQLGRSHGRQIRAPKNLPRRWRRVCLGCRLQSVPSAWRLASLEPGSALHPSWSTAGALGPKHMTERQRGIRQRKRCMEPGNHLICCSDPQLAGLPTSSKSPETCNRHMPHTSLTAFKSAPCPLLGIRMRLVAKATGVTASSSSTAPFPCSAGGGGDDEKGRAERTPCFGGVGKAMLCRCSGVALRGGAMAAGDSALRRKASGLAVGVGAETRQRECRGHGQPPGAGA